MAGTQKTTAADKIVRRYFDHYLHNTFPEQLDRAIGAHNIDVGAHKEQITAAVKVQTLKLQLWVGAIIFMSGLLGGGVGVTKLLPFISRAIK